MYACYVTIDVRLPGLKKDLNPDIILITTKKQSERI